MYGAHKCRSDAVVYLLIMAITLGSNSWTAHAEEFGNIIVPSVDDLSRNASAQALGAASLVLRGFQSRELKKPDLAAQQFARASDAFRSSFNMMQIIIKRYDSDADLKKILSEEVSLDEIFGGADTTRLRAAMLRGGVKDTSFVSKIDAFKVFANRTMIIADLFDQNYNPDSFIVKVRPPLDSKNYYGFVIREITDYLIVGGQVAKIFGARLHMPFPAPSPNPP